MKNRRNVIAVLLLVAVLCIGVGYAAISDVLEIAGSVTFNTADDGPLDQQFDADVYFANAQVTGGTNVIATGDTANVTALVGDRDATGDNDKLTITIGDTVFTDINQTVVVTVDVVNASTVQAANIEIETLENELFEVEVTREDAATTVAKNGSVAYTLTITLKQLPATDATSADFTFNLNATPVVE